MEVDDRSPLYDVSSSTLPTPPPTELQYPDTDVEVEADDTTLILPGVRRSKITALLRLKQSASPDPGTPYTEMSSDVEMGDDDADGATDSDGDDGDNENDSDFASPPTQAQPPRFRRKAEPATRQHKHDPRVGRKTTSHRRRHAKNPDSARRGYVTPKGEERQYAHPTDRQRKQLRAVHGPIWCLFCTKTAPGPDDDGDFSRVKDSPKRHLLSCKRFRASQYYRKKAETGMDHERIVERAVREQKAAGSIIRCPKRAAQQARLAKEGFTHAKVRDELERLSTVYSDCKCCEFPHFSEFRQER
ncbi:uncharacterized protein TRAVEDRAFT_47032 [Trametes versicolor FP-101664 SS1]|uniref:uncharacterized protein n=1 Tax=Trametes versicolor (strain FP-101664) TaxID=717944 RepID=UPI0004624587|nr:uncharacterized protein TRAVEDRAFT_47032 [Trametes versicolor FP-101664 SS1]EIW59734.1 hypothetical protein TRAVEDRAFT_47032 [Trametes versicolor FP-101664 SS1]